MSDEQQDKQVHPDDSNGPQPGTLAFTARAMASICPVDGDPDFWDRWKDEQKDK